MTDVSGLLADLDEHGVGVLPGVLSADEVADVRAKLLDGAARSEAAGIPTKGYFFDPDTRNTRVFMLFNLDPVFIDLVEHPTVVEIVRHALKPATGTGDFLISNFSANITAPGSGAMGLHADQGYVVPPWPDVPLAVNVAWLLDDFTEEVGATRYVPGSHTVGHSPDHTKQHDTVPVLGPAGSLMAMDGRLWHQTGPNQSADRTRAALFGYYVCRWIRPQVNWNFTLAPEVAATASMEFLDRLGYYSGNVETLLRTGA
jgi:ectoine hydroxylase-related dioxygenase (phytanoyl-CoA dioxygenase family)